MGMHPIAQAHEGENLLVEIRIPACECRSVSMTESTENCRKRKKEGGLCGGEWMSYPANVVQGLPMWQGTNNECTSAAGGIYIYIYIYVYIYIYIY